MTPDKQPEQPEYIISGEYVEKLDEWLMEHGIDEIQRMQIYTRLTLDPVSSRPNTPAPDGIVSIKGLEQKSETKSPDDRYHLCRSDVSRQACTNHDAAIARAATLAENGRVLDDIDYFVCSCQKLHDPDCDGSEDGVKDCDGCGLYEPVTIEQIRDRIESLRQQAEQAGERG